MSFINYMAREINCKIVYYGPGLCGKTTNLQYIYERTNPDAKGKMISPRDGDGAHALLRLPAALARRDPRLQDALPPLHGARPGLLRREPQAHPEGRRRRHLRRRLADRAHGGQPASRSRTCARTSPSRATRSTSSRTSCSTTSATCPNVVAVEELRELLNPTNVPEFEAVARTGVGVFDTLKAVAKLVLTELKKGGAA